MACETAWDQSGFLKENANVFVQTSSSVASTIGTDEITIRYCYTREMNMKDVR